MSDVFQMNINVRVKFPPSIAKGWKNTYAIIPPSADDTEILRAAMAHVPEAVAFQIIREYRLEAVATTTNREAEP